jgi:hypothetical protein
MFGSRVVTVVLSRLRTQLRTFIASAELAASTMAELEPKFPAEGSTWIEPNGGESIETRGKSQVGNASILPARLMGLMRFVENASYTVSSSAAVKSLASIAVDSSGHNHSLASCVSRSAGNSNSKGRGFLLSPSSVTNTRCVTSAVRRQRRSPRRQGLRRCRRSARCRSSLGVRCSARAGHSYSCRRSLAE